MPFNRRRLLQSAALAQLPLLGRAAHAADTVRVGQTVALSGSFGEMGTMYTAGIKAAFASHNQRTPQRKIELITLDDKLDGNLAAQNAKALVEQQNVTALIGVTGTGVARAVMPYCEDRKIPLFALTGDDNLRKVKQQYTFFSCASYGEEVKNMVRHGATISHKSVFMVHTDVPAGSFWVESAKASAADNNLEFRGSIAAAPDGSNADAVVQAYVASKASFAVLVYAGAGVKTLLEKLHQAHIYPGSIYLLSQGATPGLIESARTDSSGLVVSQVVPNPFSAINPLQPEYGEALKTASVPRNYLTYQGFLLGQMFSDALARIRGSLTSASIDDALQDAPFQYKNFKLDYTNGKRLGTSFTDISMLGKDGRFIS
ncbi:ABC transporter substrate-binding protein [Acidovorax sacchari]|uniref:ABC transporter substrate-binding protein n=1 Tax=Acidovorax sacchari TaxID=3230736 RepID=UPI0039E244A7